MSISPHELSVLVRGQNSLVARTHAAGVLSQADVQLARTVARLYGAEDDLLMLTIALTFAVGRAGSSCLDLAVAAPRFVDEVLQPLDLNAEELPAARADLLTRLAWPDPQEWATRLAAMPIVGAEGSEPNSVPLRLTGSMVYLERFWQAEERIVALLENRQMLNRPPVDEAVLTRSLDELFGPTEGPDSLQRLAGERAVRSFTTVLAGGPGTGKTTTVSKILAALQAQSSIQLRVGLAAPSGKAASRLGQAVAAARDKLGARLPHVEPGRTLHSLLGARGRTGEYRHGPGQPLPHDIVVVDEVSMVDLEQFGVLLSALGPATRLLLVGDPQQLKSVNAGTVLADIATSGLTLGGGSAESAITELTRGFRNEGDIHALAQAIRHQSPQDAVAVLAASAGAVELIESELTRATTWDDFARLRGVVDQQWRTVIGAAESGDARSALAGLDQHRVLCGHRDGLFGVGGWTARTLQLIRAWRPGFGVGGEFHPGRPIILTVNDSVLNLSNGDTGVILTQDGLARAAVGEKDNHRLLSPALLRGLDSLYAMTVHKSQGSQFARVTVVLPPLGSPLLTRDLLYTAVTRAQQQVSIIGSREQLSTAILTESRRASGLASRWRLDH